MGTGVLLAWLSDMAHQGASERLKTRGDHGHRFSRHNIVLCENQGPPPRRYA